MAQERYVTIEWHDEPGKPIHTIVSIDEAWNIISEDDYNDGRIFFYFANEKEYEEAKNKNNTEYEFWIVKGE